MIIRFTVPTVSINETKRCQSVPLWKVSIVLDFNHRYNLATKNQNFAINIDGQWHSWQSGCFGSQRSLVQIQSSATLIKKEQWLFHNMLFGRDENRSKVAENGSCLKEYFSYLLIRRQSCRWSRIYIRAFRTSRTSSRSSLRRARSRLAPEGSSIGWRTPEHLRTTRCDGIWCPLCASRFDRWPWKQIIS